MPLRESISSIRAIKVAREAVVECRVQTVLRRAAGRPLPGLPVVSVPNVVSRAALGAAEAFLTRVCRLASELVPVMTVIIRLLVGEVGALHPIQGRANNDDGERQSGWFHLPVGVGRFLIERQGGIVG
ncbi:hypothetical protein BST13_16135 [Mycobacterium aquaticum]|uniref:Uncharacterized protein n=1 Tax=Mycobacterium aquaticum TaxID=1927124 RepID=A0A1X0AX21_9MYCO|nr:hypothetical protein BST13_16135 [Mycobacterium aquaticum]